MSTVVMGSAAIGGCQNIVLHMYVARPHRVELIRNRTLLFYTNQCLTQKVKKKTKRKHLFPMCKYWWKRNANMQYSNIDHNSSVSISAYPLEIRVYVQQEKKIAWILILLLLQFMSLDGHQAQLKRSRF